MAREFKLPDLGEGIHEGEVIAVLVSVGDQVQEGDPIFEIETDKAAVEIPSPYTGKVAEIRAEPGDVVRVGDVLMTFDNGEPAQEKKTKEEPRRQPAKEETTPESAEEEEREENKEKQEPESKPHKKEKGPVPASPATRRLARELGVDLYDVPPTGPAGLVTAEDVRAFAEKGGRKRESVEAEAVSEEPIDFAAAAPASELPDFSQWGRIEKTPLRSIRKATARQMALAWSQIPHVSSQDDIDVTRLEALRRRHKQTVEQMGGRLTLTVFAVKAVAAALRKFPQFNVSLDVVNKEIIRKDYIHIGVATDTGEGLVVPVLRNADRKNMMEIAVELKELVERTRSRKIGLEEMKGGTFTITNIGAAGGRGHFSPIINYPEAAILGLGAASMKPVVGTGKDDKARILPRLVLPVVLTIDHRVLDGVDSAHFLEFFRQSLEDPERFLLSV